MDGKDGRRQVSRNNGAHTCQRPGTTAKASSSRLDGEATAEHFELLLQSRSGSCCLCTAHSLGLGSKTRPKRGADGENSNHNPDKSGEQLRSDGSYPLQSKLFPEC